ncbi:hypothetical protein QEP77_23910 [Serratia sp. B1]|nr:hypothetical protein QEP77_23910 [Serratia sp. B1]
MVIIGTIAVAGNESAAAVSLPSLSATRRKTLSRIAAHFSSVLPAFADRDHKKLKRRFNLLTP